MLHELALIQKSRYFFRIWNSFDLFEQNFFFQTQNEFEGKTWFVLRKNPKQ